MTTHEEHYAIIVDGNHVQCMWSKDMPLEDTEAYQTYVREHPEAQFMEMDVRDCPRCQHKA